MMIQGVITRMANNSFLLKGWSVTLVAGLTAFAADKSDPSFAFIAVAVVTVFALLDAYYLALERLYRTLFTTAAADTGAPTWNLKVDGPGFGQLLSALGSPSIWPLHGVALGAALVVAFLA
jgi:hypothetical protein